MIHFSIISLCCKQGTKFTGAVTSRGTNVTTERNFFGELFSSERAAESAAMRPAGITVETAPVAEVCFREKKIAGEHVAYSIVQTADASRNVVQAKPEATPVSGPASTSPSQKRGMFSWCAPAQSKTSSSALAAARLQLPGLSHAAVLDISLGTRIGSGRRKLMRPRQAAR